MAVTINLLGQIKSELIHINEDYHPHLVLH